MRTKVAEQTGRDKERHEDRLLLNLRECVAAARLALDDENEERSLTLLQQALALKHQLWDDLTPRVRRLARKFSPFTRRRAGLGEDDLVQEAYFKFVKLIRVWTPDGGAGVAGWVLFGLGRHFIQLGRAGRLVATEDMEQLASAPERGEALPVRLEFEDLIGRILADDPRRARKRRLFRRYWFEGWTMTQLARKEKVSVSTIYKWLTQAGAAFAELYVASEG